MKITNKQHNDAINYTIFMDGLHSILLDLEVLTETATNNNLFPDDIIKQNRLNSLLNEQISDKVREIRFMFDDVVWEQSSATSSSLEDDDNNNSN
jgi:hypothetical protein